MQDCGDGKGASIHHLFELDVCARKCLLGRSQISSEAQSFTDSSSSPIIPLLHHLSQSQKMTTTPTHLPSFRTSLSKALTTDKNAPLHDPSSSKTSLRLRKLILESPYLKKPFQGKLNEHEAKRLQKVFNLVSNLDELRLELRTKVHETNMRVNQFIRQSCFEIVEDFTSADSSDHEAQKKDGNEKIEESKRNKNFFNIFKSLRKEVRDVLLEVESEVGARFRDCEEGVRDGSIFECSKDGEGDQRMEDG